MALVNCYECGRQISDKAQSCPNCGAPITFDDINLTDNNAYVVYFDGFNNINCYKLYRTKMSICVGKIYGGYVKEVERPINTNKPCILFDRISKTSSNQILEMFTRFNCVLRVESSSVNIINHQLDQRIKEVYEDSLVLKCPRCKSTAITTGTKGYGLVRGFLGSNKTVNRCGKCGYSWEP